MRQLLIAVAVLLGAACGQNPLAPSVPPSQTLSTHASVDGNGPVSGPAVSDPPVTPPTDPPRQSPKPQALTVKPGTPDG